MNYLSGIETITNQIISDAKEKAEKIIAEGSAKAENFIKLGEANLEKTKYAAVKESSVKATEHKRRLLATASMEAKKEILATKQHVITESFTLALEQLASWKDNSYLTWLEKLLQATLTADTSQVIFSNKDRELIDKNWFSKIFNEKEVEILWGDFAGGFIIKSAGSEINCSLEALLYGLRDKIEPEVAKTLF